MINNEEKFERVLEELMDKIGGYPNTLLNKETVIKTNPINGSNRTKKALYSIQESIDDMRICVKYLLFDLDATRRENLYFKKLLDDKEA